MNSSHRSSSYAGSMRIVLVNWSRVWDGTRIGGGVGGYVQGLARALVGLGHDVVTLHAGQEAVPAVDPGTFCPAPGPVELRRHMDWEGIRCFEIVNTPVLAPARFQARDPLTEIASAELDAELCRFASLIKPDVIHLHNIEGLTASAIRALRQGCSAKILYSVHNYHTVCPQVYLMKQGASPCRDFEGGLACESCVLSPGVSDDPQTEWHRRWTGAMKRLNVPVGPPLIPTIEGRLPGAYEPVQSQVDATRELPLDGEDSRGIFIRPGPMIEDFVLSTEPADNSLDASSGAGVNTGTRFGRRRAAMIDMLNGCDRVLAVSTFVHQRMQTLGVRPSVLKTMTIGTTAAQSNQSSPSATSGRAAADRIRLCFLGFNHVYKGLHVLLDAIDALAPDIAAKIDLSLFVGEIWRTGPRLSRTQQRVHSLTTRDGYEPSELGILLRGIDIGVVPSIWWDNGPQTVMEFLAHNIPVLGANIGGIPDFVTHGKNGLLFRANDRTDLARIITDLVRDPAQFDMLRAGITAPKSMDEHAGELLAEYVSLGVRA